MHHTSYASNCHAKDGPPRQWSPAPPPHTLPATQNERVTHQARCGISQNGGKSCKKEGGVGKATIVVKGSGVGRKGGGGATTPR